MAASKKGFAVIGRVEETFKFQLNGSKKVWSLPLIGTLPIKLSRDISKISKLDDAEQLDRMIDVFDELCPGLTDVVSGNQLNEIITLWCDASGITPGESPTSSD